MALLKKDRNIKYVVKHVSPEGEKYLSRFNTDLNEFSNTELLRVAYHFCSYDKADLIAKHFELKGPEVLPVVIEYTLQD